MNRMTKLLAALAALLALALPANSAPKDAISAGDMPGLTEEIESIWKGLGLSWPDWIEWKIGTYTTVYWYYDTAEDDVIVGDMPTAEQIADYWQVWSKALTDGNFDPDAFFASPQEALELGRYNQFVLATHETAHVMTYRYDYGHRERHSYEINCREYYADRLTASILQDQAGRDADMARWRLRYLDLVRAMHATIPEQYLVAKANYADLEADCSVIKVDQPTPDRLQAYASAYFTRHAALLSVRLPALKVAVDTHLEQRRIATLQTYPHATDLPGFGVETLADAGPVETGLTKIDDATGARSYNAYAFGPDGTLFVAAMTHDASSGLVDLAFGPKSSASTALGPKTPWPRKVDRLELESLAVFGPDLAFMSFLESGDVATIVRCRRDGDTWTVEIVAENEGTGAASVFRSPSGRLVVARSRLVVEGSDEVDKTWTVGIFDPVAMGDPVTAMNLPVAASGPIGADDEGRLYFSGFRQIVRIEREPAISYVAGSGLYGHLDGPPGTGQLNIPVVMQATDDGGALLLDRRPDLYGEARIRRLVPAPSE